MEQRVIKRSSKGESPSSPSPVLLDTQDSRIGSRLLFVGVQLFKRHFPQLPAYQLEQMGYNPQLRYLETEQGIQLYTLLQDEQHDPTQPIPDEYGFDELMALDEAF